MQRVLKRGLATVGWAEARSDLSIYSVYWRRWQERSTGAIHDPIELTVDNYSRIPKAVEVLACKTEDFLAASQSLVQLKAKDNDALLVRELLEHGSVILDAQFKAEWLVGSTPKVFCAIF